MFCDRRAVAPRLSQWPELENTHTYIHTHMHTHLYLWIKLQSHDFIPIFPISIQHHRVLSSFPYLQLRSLTVRNLAPIIFINISKQSSCLSAVLRYCPPPAPPPAVCSPHCCLRHSTLGHTGPLPPSQPLPHPSQGK